MTVYSQLIGGIGFNIDKTRTRIGLRFLSNHSLIGTMMSRLTLRLKKADTPTNTVFVRLRSSTDAIKKDLGSLSAGGLTTQFADYTFTFSSIKIETGDIISIESSNVEPNYVIVDGTNDDPDVSRMEWFEGSWFPVSSDVKFQIVYEPIPFTSDPQIFGSVLASIQNFGVTSDKRIKANIGYTVVQPFYVGATATVFRKIITGNNVQVDLQQKTVTLQNDGIVTFSDSSILAAAPYTVQGYVWISNLAASEIANQVITIQADAPPPEEPPVIDDSVTTSMITQSPVSFKMENNRVTGQINYLATNSFNPFWYDKRIVSLVQIKNSSNQVITIKENSLFFSSTEKDETIFIDENVFPDLLVNVDLMVTTEDKTRFFSNKVTMQIQQGVIPLPPTEATAELAGSLWGKAAVLLGILGVMNHK